MDALEVATRLKNFLGKDHPPVPVELLAKPGQWQAPLGQQSPYVTTVEMRTTLCSESIFHAR